jgi:hypothetical protein
MKISALTIFFLMAVSGASLAESEKKKPAVPGTGEHAIECCSTCSPKNANSCYQVERALREDKSGPQKKDKLDTGSSNVNRKT